MPPEGKCIVCDRKVSSAYRSMDYPRLYGEFICITHLGLYKRLSPYDGNIVAKLKEIASNSEENKYMLEGPCCICGQVTGIKIDDVFVCSRHRGIYTQLLESDYYTDPIAKLRSVYNRTVTVETRSLIIIDLISGRSQQFTYNEAARREYLEVSDFIEHLMEGLTGQDGDPIVIVAYWIVLTGNVCDSAVSGHTVSLERIEL